MNRYTYKFVWEDSKDKRHHTKYVEAASLVEAKATFQENWGELVTGELSIIRL